MQYHYIVFTSTPQPLYNKVRYNMVLDITDQCWTPNDHLGLIFLFNNTFYSRYNTDWIANTEIGLDPNNSVIKRLWCTYPGNKLPLLNTQCCISIS